MTTLTADDRRVAARIDEVVANYGLAEVGGELPVRTSMRRRRGFDPSFYNGLATLSLIKEDGVLRWVSEPPPLIRGSRRARRASAPTIGAEVVNCFSFQQVPPNQVIEALEKLDKKLTPDRGLRRLIGGTLAPYDGQVIAGKVLLLIHGTFSKSQMFLDELGSFAEGKAFLAAASQHYTAILAFDHPTLSVSPWINALDLEYELVNVRGTIDVVCHSRGGLVTAWWLRNAKRNVNSIIFVGSPLEGTSLAAPAKLRNALDMLANVFKGLEIAGSATTTMLPFMAAVVGISTIFSGILRVGANTPLVDLGVAVIPGLASQSLVGNNAELRCLRRPTWASTPAFHAVTSNFEPAPADGEWWQFWKRFRGMGSRIVDDAADAIFQGENDLVVDTGSMKLANGAPLKAANILDYGSSPSVHHCNYFSQVRTAKYLTRVLQV